MATEWIGVSLLVAGVCGIYSFIVLLMVMKGYYKTTRDIQFASVTALYLIIVTVVMVLLAILVQQSALGC